MTTHETQKVSNKIFTLPNMLSFIRLLMIPIFLVLLFNDLNFAATILFAIAASTDWVDGQVARRTNQVTRLGQILDPAVDRLLMISGVAGLFFIGRLPLWIILFVLIRDIILLAGGAYLLERYKIRVPVIYLGKVATTLLYIGFAGILLNFPLLDGLALCDFSWLPGFSTASYSWGFWFAYAGIVLSVFTTSYYVAKAVHGLKIARAGQTGPDHG